MAVEVDRWAGPFVSSGAQEKRVPWQKLETKEP